MNPQPPPDIVGPLILVTVTIVLAIIAATWKLSGKIGDLRVHLAEEIAEVRENAAERSEKVDAMWNWWTGPRDTRPERALAHRAGQ